MKVVRSSPREAEALVKQGSTVQPSRRDVVLAAPALLLLAAPGALGEAFTGPVGAVARELWAGLLAVRWPVEPTSEPSTATGRRLTAAVLDELGDAAPVSSLVLLDRRNGRRWRHRGAVDAPMASIAKVLVVAQALRAAPNTGRPVAGWLREQATLAITQSDNDAGDALYRQIGGHVGVAAIARDLRMTATAVGPAATHWGTTRTCAEDLVTMMATLVDPPADSAGVIAAQDRAFLLDLMGHVVDGQRWGVGTVRSAAVRVRIKNGWMSVDHPWVISSVGDVRGRGRDYVLAIVQRAQPEEETGMTRASRLGRLVFDVLEAEL